MKRTIFWLAWSVLGNACGDDKEGGTAAGTNPTTADMDSSNSSAGDGAKSGGLKITLRYVPSVPLNVADGWSMRHDRFLVTAGEFIASMPRGYTLNGREIFVVHLTDGYEPSLFQWSAVPVGASEPTSFSMPIAESTSDCILCDEDDRSLMEDGGYSLYVEGILTNDAGQSCVPGDPTDCVPATQVRYRWGIPTGVQFLSCPNVSVEEDQTTEFTWIIPDDRWLMTDFTAGADSKPRRAQWIADADLDRDGETTLAELKQIKASVLFLPELGYDLSTAPIETAYDFLLTQVYAIALTNGCRNVQPSP